MIAIGVAALIATVLLIPVRKARRKQPGAVPARWPARVTGGQAGRSSLEEAAEAAVPAPGAKRLLNSTERKFWHALTEAVSDARGVTAFPQVSLSQIVDFDTVPLENGEKRKALHLVCDFVVFDRNLYPLLVMEVNGKGHYQGGWRERDALKSKVLSAAGIPVQYAVVTEEFYRPRNHEALVESIRERIVKVCSQQSGR